MIEVIFVFLGLDVSKNKIDCYLSVVDKHITIANDIQGYVALLEWLKQNVQDLSQIHACCEATNVYHKLVVNYLHSNKIAVSVANPAQIHAYFKLKNKRIKTDKQDAKLIAHYVQDEKPELWQPKSNITEQIQSQTRRVEQLTNMITQEKNRKQVTDEYSELSVQRTLNFLETELQTVKENIQSLIDENAELKQKHEILKTIVGVGNDTAQVLLGVLINIDKYSNARNLVAHLGLSPKVRESGNWKGHKKLSKMGDKYIRKSLYMPARAACLNSKLWRGWFDEHIKRGKHPKQVYILMMIKILKYAYACLKTNTEFDKAKHMKSFEIKEKETKNLTH